MKIHPAPQGSDEWHEARLGLPTASNFDRIVTPMGRASGGQAKYMAELLSEWFYGVPACDYESDAMQRGTREEADAVKWYRWEKGVAPEPVGLCLTDDGRAGASPDGLVRTDGTCELKAPLANTVFLYWLNGRPESHKVQRQGQLWVTERAYSDLVIYHPIEQLRKIVTDQRDEPFIKTLADEVGKFCDRMDEARANLAASKREYDESQQREHAESEAMHQF